MYGEVGVIGMNNQMTNNNSVIDANQIGSTSGNQVNQTMNQMGVQGASTPNPNNRATNVRGGANVSGIDKKIIRKLPKKESEDKKYTENWLDIKTITNGIIYNKEGYMVTGVKIAPKNIFILDQSQMDNTLIGLMNFYNTIDFEFWLMVADRPVDIGVYEAEMKLLYSKTYDQRMRKVIAQDLDKAEYFKNNNVVDTEYYILFKEKKMDLLQKKLRNMINSLAAAGLNATPTTNNDLRTLVDNFLNGGKTYESGGVMPL